MSCLTQSSIIEVTTKNTHTHQPCQKTDPQERLLFLTRLPSNIQVYVFGGRRELVTIFLGLSASPSSAVSSLPLSRSPPLDFFAAGASSSSDSALGRFEAGFDLDAEPEPAAFEGGFALEVGFEALVVAVLVLDLVALTGAFTEMSLLEATTTVFFLGGILGLCGEIQVRKVNSCAEVSNSRAAVLLLSVKSLLSRWEVVHR
jgi:hypothetical protein